MRSNTFPPGTKYICQICSLSIRPPARQRRLWTASREAAPTPRPLGRMQWRAASTATATPSQPRRQTKEKSFWENDWTIYSADNAHLVRKAQTFGNEVLNSKSIPSEEVCMKAMKVIEFASSQLTRPTTVQPVLETKETESQTLSRPHAGLLSLDSKTAHPMSISISVDLLSTLAYKIITHPPVFITSHMLASYVALQSALQRPTTFPEIFELYARKPTPVPGSSPVKYKTPNPKSSKQAISPGIADRALEAAIESTDLHLALAVIETTYATPAFQWNKFVTKALPGLTALGLAPAAALTLASQIPSVTNAADPTQMTIVAFASILTYVTAAGTLGFVAITTRNDQMERVTWIPGLPLRARWSREEERAALDKVAMAWGFKEVSRRGEEEGEEWEDLKEWCGIRGMILDRVSLMEGMQ